MLKPGLPKLIATDLDGTLVRSDDTVSAFTHDVLDRVRAAGIRIVAATGRGPRLTSLVRNDIRVADYLVLAQGGWVLDQAESRYLRQARLPGEALGRALAALESAIGSPLSVMFEALEHDESPLWGDYDPTWRYPVTVETRTRAECLTGDVIKAFARSFRHDVDELLAVARRVVPADLATVTQAGLDYVEICPSGVDKGTGLAVVAESVGVDPADVLVFGDMPNDLPMFAWAGWGRVAVANAHPELLAQADAVTLTNDQDGVAVFLNELLSR
ncbi:putative haloacid dehalogenase-like hydrolase [Actinoplanes missouriensis 431]|uniref:Putative haloacid dehalogenase-like hydrolase n=1 Tax=Actinoplanes missouriensis (strain ATCC 14538 / DSM 43046 / CBS 188.64 / JCM 3121 / NBRC 102363 / NCIMB 12654 / NRRL B-3342 / UNCC 431) TaxID=512565 RepID=I0HJT6_ACTM4|nr:HAD family hydrolase [Actinoplanes missouriensis]BAL93273.1 putative haloacid dehalogenase-like hydrolase [Actinoplanes missouriensis 431]